MDCPSCGHPNRVGARFCGSCGASLAETTRCAECGTENPPGQRFCDGCGHALEAARGEAGSGAAPSLPQAPATPAPLSYTPEHLAAKIRADAAALEGERKQVTILFADVVGSMELAAAAGPESWRRIMDRLFALCCEAVHRFEGTVDKFTGDGAMVLFGAPLAHEDHARRACYAALSLQESLAPYAAELRRNEGLSLSLRVGLNSGEVVVGSIGADLALEYTAVGHTVGLAQRMEQLAEPGTAYLTRDTAALVDGFVKLKDLGEFEVKGVEEPIRVHELLGTGGARGRLDISRERGFSRFVGRGEEMRALESAFETAFDGNGQVIGLVGEAGVGKSRLCHEFAERARAKGLPVYHATAQAHTQDVPLLPVLHLLRTYFDIGERDTDQTARERIAGKLLLLDESFTEDLPLMFDLLSISDPQRPSPPMDPETRMRKLLDLIRRLSRAQGHREPGVTVFEDLHWIDPASEAFLASNIEAVQGTPSLTIVNFRPEYHAAWMSKSYYRQIALAPLGPEAIQELLDDLLGSDPSLGGLPEQIRERTGGNPFFIEEVVQSLVEAGSLEGERGHYALSGPARDVAVPATVQAVLSARIDRLEEREKSVLQTAAVIGKEFSEPVLARVVERERSELQEALGRLVGAEFVFEQALFPEALYAFKHPLTQEVAYGSQLGDRRAALHSAVARALIEEGGERLPEHSALLARHWEAAGETLEAARWNAVAAGRAGTSDPKQALLHWRRVRELTDSLPELEEAASLGLAARIFTLQFGWRLGMSRDEAEATFEEAQAIASRAGDIRSRAALLATYAGIKGLNEGDIRAQAGLSRQAVALAEESEEPEVFVTTALSVYALSLAGRAREAIEVVDRAIELADGDATLGAGVSVRCPLAHCLIFKGGYLITMGELEEARRLIRAGTKMAADQGDIEVIGWGHLWLGLEAGVRGRPEEELGHAKQALEIAERIGDSFSRTHAWSLLGASERAHGRFQASIEALERARAMAREHRTGLDIEPHRLSTLAESLSGIGEGARAREALETGFEFARARGTCWARWWPASPGRACC